ncbi:MAG: hypothetical protein UX28_C0001G0057 [Candidatus Pacebacteria bacterium GW2011_GWA1_46_10]|nr:MAG: hypothetical protein UX28_C0001G0057 [Candidatus Pacebacteria bacterium GW2011_GWA1_46_10]HCR80990.1 hypothetical protein [Candidatus Paceibacterota bacterium]
MNFMKLLRTISKSFIGRTVAVAFSPPLQLFSATLFYYFSLYFSINNRTLFLLTFLYWLVIFRLTKNFKLSLFAGLLATLLFPKGRAYQLLLLPKESIERWVLFDISYFFPVYLADIFLGVLGYLYLRNKTIVTSIGATLKKLQPFWWLALFIIWVVFSGTLSVAPEVSWLSALQLVRMMALMVLPLLLFAHQKTQLKKLVLSVALAALLFESSWVIAQRISGGPLGKDLEVYLPGAQFGILASEDLGLLRVTGTFFEPSILGTFLLMQMAIILPLVLRKRHTDQRHILNTLGWFGLGVGSVALIFTGSRILYGVWLWLAGLTWWFWRKNKPNLNFKNHPKLFAGTVVVALIVATALAPYLTRRLETLTDVFTQYGSGTYRLAMIQYAARLALGNPWFGVGINLSPYYFATEFTGEQLVFDPTYPHNLLFQLLAETGMVGAFFFFMLVYTTVRPFFLYLKQSVIKEYSLAVGIYVLCAMFYPIFLNHPELSSYFFLYAGLSTLSRKQARVDRA